MSLGLVRQGSKRRFVKHRQIGQDLAIHLDGSLLQAVHQGAVLHPQFPGTGVDTGDPEGTELALALPAVPVLVLPRLHHRFFGNPINGTTTTPVTLGGVENLLVAPARRYTPLDSWHLGVSL